MAGRSPVTANEEQRATLKAMASGAGRAEADRARAILLTLSGWTSPQIAEAFGVREDTVRLWRSDFMAGGVAALARRVAAGPAPVKAEAEISVRRLPESVSGHYRNTHHTSPTKRSTDFITLLEEIDRRYGPRPGLAVKPVVMVLDNGPMGVSEALCI